MCSELCRSVRLKLHRVWFPTCSGRQVCCTTHSVRITTALALHGKTWVCSMPDSSSCRPVEGERVRVVGAALPGDLHPPMELLAMQQGAHEVLMLCLNLQCTSQAPLVRAHGPSCLYQCAVQYVCRSDQLHPAWHVAIGGIVVTSVWHGGSKMSGQDASPPPVG